MTAEVKILIEGYTNADSVVKIGEEKTQSTVTLVKDGDLIIVVDPGVLESQQLLIDALAEENLTVDDVNVVCITHSHLDHYRNIGMFPNAKTLEYFGLWDKNSVETWQENFTLNTRVLHTPGHDYTGITLIVKTKDGMVAICGDVFWKENYPLNPHDDAFASNPEKLKESRMMVLKLADWIIPGHGGIYKNNRDSVQSEKPKVKLAAQPKITVRCKKCRKEMSQKDKCECRPHICFRCCECGYDCPACSCSHKRKIHE
ncbi:MAG: MBL fold metallo-hydrolase [Candidatus Staskawiczbacteria bacterium]|nr:MBL fold metallo-hydrolase [Candidatus Staskawiczbacteria bacterium]